MAHKAKTVKDVVVATTREFKDGDGKPLKKSKEFEFPILDEKLENLIAFYGDAEKVYDIVIKAQVIVYQAELRREIESEQAGDTDSPARSNSLLERLKGRK